MSKLIFVYKKDKGFMNGIFDFFHKIMKPVTYSCSNFTKSHNYRGMQDAWKSYLEWLPIPSDFYDDEQFYKQFPSIKEIQLPCVYIEHENQNLEVIISAEDLKEEDLNQLCSLINKRIVSCKLENKRAS